jgi:hypothetical protein
LLDAARAHASPAEHGAMTFGDALNGTESTTEKVAA